MSHEIRAALHEGLRTDPAVRLPYTRRAYSMLPALDRPRILDLGCGPGDPTLALARLSGGQVVGLDTSLESLAELRRQAVQTGLDHRVLAVAGSMSALCFGDGSFDLVWTEGAIWALGFEEGLRQWRRLLAPSRFLVVHEMAWLQPDPPAELRHHCQGWNAGIRTVPEYAAAILDCGYELLGHFALPEDAWWEAYFRPLQERVAALREKYAGDAAAQAVLDGEQREVDLYVKYQKWYGSAFFLMRIGAG